MAYLVYGRTRDGETYPVARYTTLASAKRKGKRLSWSYIVRESDSATLQRPFTGSWISDPFPWLGKGSRATRAAVLRVGRKKYKAGEINPGWTKAKAVRIRRNARGKATHIDIRV